MVSNKKKYERETSSVNQIFVVYKKLNIMLLF